MNVLDAEFVKGFIQMADDGWAMGWHERNGGNLSYRIRPEEIDAIRDQLTPGVLLPIGASVPLLAGEYFLITGTGRFFRNVRTRPEESIGIIHLDGAGENYRIVWGLSGGGRPTSELPSHLLGHQVKLQTTGGRHRIIYHAHPANVIALTFVLPLTDAAFTRELWEMVSECAVVFPQGVGVVPWMVPGSPEIAAATMEKLQEYDAVIWAHHGMFSSGETFDLTFGLMHTIEKAAEILVKVRSMAQEKRQTITKTDFAALAEHFGVTLPEKFLKDS